MTTNNIPLIINSFLPYGPLLRKANSFHEGLINIVEKEIKENNLEENVNNTFTKMKNDELVSLNRSEIIRIEEELQVIKTIKELTQPPKISVDQKKEKLKEIINQQKQIEPSPFEVEEKTANKIKENYNILISNVGNSSFSIKEDLVNFNLESSLPSYFRYLDLTFNQAGINNLNIFFFDILDEKDNLLVILDELFFYWNSIKTSNTLCYEVFKEQVDFFKNNGELSINDSNFLIEYESLFSPFNSLFKVEDHITTLNNLYSRIENQDSFNEIDYFNLINDLNESIKIFKDSLLLFTEIDLDLNLKNFLKTFKKKEKKEIANIKKKDKSKAKELSYSFDFRKEYYSLALLLKYLRDANGYARYFLNTKGRFGSYNPVFVYNYLKEETLNDSNLILDVSLVDSGNEFNFWELLFLSNGEVENYQESFDMTTFFLVNKEEEIVPIDETNKPVIDFFDISLVGTWNEKKVTAFYFYRMEILSYLFGTFNYFKYYSTSGEQYSDERLFKINLYLEGLSEPLYITKEGISFELNNSLMQIDHSLSYIISETATKEAFLYNKARELNFNFDNKIQIDNLNVGIKEIKIFTGVFFNFGISFLLESRKKKNNFKINNNEEISSFSLPFVSLNSFSNFDKISSNRAILIYFLENLITLEVALGTPFDLFSKQQHENLANWLFQDPITCASLISYEDFTSFYTESYLVDDLDTMRSIVKTYLERYWSENKKEYCFVNLFKVDSTNETIKKEYEDLFKKLYFTEEQRDSVQEEIKPIFASTEESPFEDVLYPEYGDANYLYYQNTLDGEVDLSLVEIVTYRKLEEDILFIEVNKGNYFISQTRDEIFWDDSVYRQFETKIDLWKTDNVIDDNIVNSFPKRKGLIDFFKVNEKKKKVDFFLDEFEIINQKRTWKQNSKTIKCSLVLVDGDFVLVGEAIQKTEQDLLVTEYKLLLKEITDLFMSKSYTPILKSKVDLIKTEKFKSLLIEKDLKFVKIVQTTLIGK